MRLACLALSLWAAVCVTACDLPGRVPANVAVVVDDTDIPWSRYDHLVETTKRGLEARGIPFDTSSSSGQARLKSVWIEAIRGLVHEAVINEIARQKKIQLSDQELAQARTEVIQALGGQEALAQRLDQTGESDQDFSDQLRLVRLQAKLRQADPNYEKHFNDAVKAARVSAYAPPCQDDHQYPRCIGGQA